MKKPLNEMTRTDLIKVIKYYQQRQKEFGNDIDYLNKLNKDELIYMYYFVKEYYNGEQIQDAKLKKEVNHHRYAARTDALTKTITYEINEVADCEDHYNDS